jgi:membrane protein YqaA with SNARE-associated domain
MTTDAQSEESSAPSWAERLAESRLGIAVLSFMESTVVPVPLETVIAPLMVSYTARAITIATAALLGCLLGSALFYWVGRFALDPVVLPALEALGLEQQFEDLREKLTSGRNAFVAVLLISLSPAPMQLATLGAGTVGANFLLYLAAIAFSRGIRYYGLAILCRLIGERIEHLRIPKRVSIPAGILTLAGLWAAYEFLL